MRVFKTKAVSRFIRREGIHDVRLIKAVEAAQRGLIDADLGGGIVKQRIARDGEGKRSGYRMLIAFQSDRLAVFLFGFANNDRGNIDDDQLTTLREIAAAWFAADETKLTRAIQDGTLIEVTDGDENESEI